MSLESEKNHSNDRILVLKPVEGKKALNSLGQPDTRLFTGENVVHISQSPIDLLWGIRYTAGNTPPALKEKFTTFGKALAFVREYFQRRNIEIAEVLDYEDD